MEALVLLPGRHELEEYRPVLSPEEEIRSEADVTLYVKKQYGESATYASLGVLKELLES